MTSKKNLSLLFSFLFFIGLKSQTDTLGPMRKEFYLSIATSSPLSITLKYKKQISKRTYLKVALVNLSGSYSRVDNGPQTFHTNSIYGSGGVEIGFERRRILTKKLSFFHGPALRLTTDYSQRRNPDPSIPLLNQKSTSNSFTGAIPYSLGFLFQVYNNFYAAIEINPSLYGTYQTSKSAGQYFYNFNTGIRFDNRYALFSFVYRY